MDVAWAHRRRNGVDFSLMGSFSPIPNGSGQCDSHQMFLLFIVPFHRTSATFGMSYAIGANQCAKGNTCICIGTDKHRCIDESHQYRPPSFTQKDILRHALRRRSSLGAIVVRLHKSNIRRLLPPCWIWFTLESQHSPKVDCLCHLCPPL